MKAPGHAIHRSTAPWPMLFSLMCNGIAPNRIGRRSQEVVEARLDNFVALARRLFKAGTIENFYSPPNRSYEAGRLQRLRSMRHRKEIDAQHIVCTELHATVC
jgi:hypothetical protein